MLQTVSVLLMMGSTDGTLGAVAFGFIGTVLVLWGSERKRTEIFGHAVIFAALAYYVSGFIVYLVLSTLKHKIDRQAVASIMSGLGGSFIGPWLKDASPKWLNKKAGLGDDN